MASQLQLRRGTTVQHGPFIGAPAEVTVDTDKKTVVVHDGTTPGGFPSATAAELTAGLAVKADTTALTAGLATKVSVGAAAGGALSGTYPNPTLAAVTATGSTAPRSVQDRFADVINVKDFGAVGDGVADDTAAIMAAINFARLNATTNDVYRPTVYFPAGDYAVTTITLNSYRGINFVGEGTIDGVKRRTRLKYIGANGTSALLVLISCQHLSFTGFTFYTNLRENLGNLVLMGANESTASSPLSRLSNNWITFTKCVFFVDIGIVAKPPQTIWAKNCSAVILEECRVMSGTLVALRIGADSDNDPVTGNPTLANGIAVITRLINSYFTGDIAREKSYLLEIKGTQFGIVDSLNSAIGGTGPRRPARLGTSGNAVCFAETITGNVWDPTETDSFTGALIDSGSNSDSTISVCDNQLAGQNTLVRVNAGSAIVTGNRGIASGVTTANLNRFVDALAGSRNVLVYGNNDQEFCVTNTGGDTPAVMLRDGRSTKVLPTLITSQLGADVTLPTAGDFVNLISVSHKFTGGYARISYSMTVQHKDSGVMRTYNARVRIDSSDIELLTRRISLTALDEYGVLSASAIIYIPQTDAAVNIILRAMQSTGTTLGEVHGNGNAQTSFTVELLNS